MSGRMFPKPSSCMLRWMMGVLLLTAALLKFQQWTEASRAESVTITLILCEMTLGILLLSGKWERFSLFVSTTLFGSFAAVSLWKMILHAGDCGCFGKLHLSPAITFWIDLLACLTGFWVLKNDLLILGIEKIPRLLLLVFGIAFVSLGFSLAKFATITPLACDSKSWIGHSWPPAEAVDISADLTQGSWIVFLYGSECGHCQSLASDYLQSASQWRQQEKKIRLALVDADLSDDSEKPPSDPKVIRGRLLTPSLLDHTPILLHLVNGKVRGVHEGWEEADWSSAPYSSWIR